MPIHSSVLQVLNVEHMPTLPNIKTCGRVNAPLTARLKWRYSVRLKQRKERSYIVTIEALPIGMVEDVEELTNQFNFELLMPGDRVKEFLN